MVDPWLSLLIQVPLVGILVYFVLETRKQEAAERVERNGLLLADLSRRDEQWRTFLAQRDEQWRGTLREIQDTTALTYSAIIKQLEACDAQMVAFNAEIRASQVKFTQLEQVLVLSLDDMRRVTGTPLNKSMRKRPAALLYVGNKARA